MNQDYQTIIKVDATAEKAFEGINNVSKWWTENVEGSSQKLNDEFTVTFGTTWKIFKIIEIIPNQKVVWEVIDCHLPWNAEQSEWTGTKISFEISQKENQAQILFTHQGLVPAFHCFNACSNAWGQYLQQSLVNLVATGKGEPDVKKIMA